MTGPESARPLQGPQGLGNAGPTEPRSAAPGDATAFRRLLEQLETVAQRAADSATTSTDAQSELHALHDALHDADRDYEQLMQLRRHLEQAFQRSRDADV